MEETATSDITPNVEPIPTRNQEESRLTDAKLIRAARKGSADAAEAIVLRHWADAERIATLVVGDRSAAEDIAQESLLSLLSSLHRFDERRRIGPWLNRIVVNQSIDWLRSQPPVASPGDAVSASSPAGTSDPALTNALARLPERDRLAVVMRTVLAYRATEIAKVLDEPPATTRSRIHRALNRLRADLAMSKE